MVGAGFEHEHAIALLQSFYPGSTFHVSVEVPLVACQHDAETCQRYFGRNECRYFFKYLTVRDREAGTYPGIREETGDIFRLQDDGGGVVVEYVAEHLYLWKDHASGGSLGVDRGDEQHDVTRGNQVADERSRAVVFRVPHAFQGIQNGSGIRVACREVDDRTTVFPREAFLQCRREGSFVLFVVNDKEGEFLFLETPGELPLVFPELIARDDKDGDVGLRDGVTCFRDACFTQCAGIVNACRVDKYDRREAGNLVASFHEVGSRSGNVRNDSDILACQGVDQGTFSTVAAT